MTTVWKKKKRDLYTRLTSVGVGRVCGEREKKALKDREVILKSIDKLTLTKMKKNTIVFTTENKGHAPPERLKDSNSVHIAWSLELKTSF